MSFFATCVYLRKNLRAVWPHNASLYASSTSVHLQLLASPFDQGLRKETVDLCQHARIGGIIAEREWEEYDEATRIWVGRVSFYSNGFSERLDPGDSDVLDDGFGPGTQPHRS